jgi:NhaA family Na+:H+ antiporter
MAQKPQNGEMAEKAVRARNAAEKVVQAASQPIEAVAAKAKSGLKSFAEIEASGGLALVLAAVAALIVSNSALAQAYDDFFHAKFILQFGPYDFGKSLLHWINDGLMAIFFFLVGLEIKREFLEGELNSVSKLILPLFAAAGGMIVPAGIFIAINAGNKMALEGWAIPMATDIAFALGALALLSKRVPASLSIFLLSLAIFDDLGAIIIIALFYAGKISLFAILAAAALLCLLVVLNLAGVRSLMPYLVVGLLLWLAVLESGVHATIAGVLLAFTIPIGERDGHSPLKWLEHRLHPWSAFLILPVFAFANAGVPLGGISLSALGEGMTLGIILGLVVGKPLGVLIASRLAMLFKGVALPAGATWPMLFGASLLAGIGFTMSLFIGTLAFETSQFDAQIRLGVLGGSILAAILGLGLLYFSTKRSGV